MVDIHGSHQLLQLHLYNLIYQIEYMIIVITKHQDSGITLSFYGLYSWICSATTTIQFNIIDKIYDYCNNQ